MIEKSGGDRGRGRRVGEEEGKEKDGEVETVGEEVEREGGDHLEKEEDEKERSRERKQELMKRWV